MNNSNNSGETEQLGKDTKKGKISGEDGDSPLRSKNPVQSQNGGTEGESFKLSAGL